MLVEVEEIVALQQLVGKFGERHTVVGISREAFFHRVFRHHIVDGDVLAHIADKLEETVVFHPIVVVDQDGGIGRIAVEIEEFFQLLAQAFLIVAQRMFIDKHTLLALHRRVANHTGGTANECDGAVSGTLKVLQHHNAHQVSDMERIGSGVDAHVSRGHFFVELFFGAGHHVVNHPAPFQFFYEINFTHQ